MATNPVITRSLDANSNSVAQIASGSFATNAFDQNNVDVTIPLGFKPRYVKVVNLTDSITYEWFAGNASPGSMKTVANGTRSLIASEAGGLTINGPATSSASGTAVAQVSDPGLLVGGEHTNAQGGLQGNGFTMDEDVIIASKTYSWIAFG